MWRAVHDLHDLPDRHVRVKYAHCDARGDAAGFAILARGAWYCGQRVHGNVKRQGSPEGESKEFGVGDERDCRSGVQRGEAAMLQKKELMRLAKTTARRRAVHARGLAARAPADAAVGSSSGVLTLSVNDGSAVRVYDSQTRSITEGRGASQRCSGHLRRQTRTRS